MASAPLAVATAAVCLPSGIVGGVVGGVAGGVVGGVVGTVSDNRELGKQVLVLRCSVDTHFPCDSVPPANDCNEMERRLAPLLEELLGVWPVRRLELPFLPLLLISGLPSEDVPVQALVSRLAGRALVLSAI